MAELRERRSQAIKNKNQASKTAANLRAQEKGVAAAAASLAFTDALAQDRERAVKESERLKADAEAQEAVAREERWKQEVAEELLAQEAEKKSVAAGQLKGCKFKALENLMDCTATELNEIETVLGEEELVSNFIQIAKKKMQTLAKLSPPWVALAKEVAALEHKKQVLEKEKRMFVPTCTDKFGPKAFEVKKGAAAAFSANKVGGKQRNFKWTVRCLPSRLPARFDDTSDRQTDDCLITASPLTTACRPACP